MKRLVVICAAFAVAASVALADDSVWQGADGAFLNDAANWNGTAPFAGTSENDMKFADSPSKAYTVRLSDDLVCAGTWSFSAKPVTMTWDLGGHTMTFLKRYNNHAHQGWTNVFENGTVAFTNATGQLLEVCFWHQNGGAALSFGKGSSFIGNFKFQDSGTKALDVHDGAQWRGNMIIPGIRSRATVTGEGTLVDLNGTVHDQSGGTISVGGNGDEAVMEILDGAVVTNGVELCVGANEACSGDGSRLVVSNATLKLTGYKTYTNNQGNPQEQVKEFNIGHVLNQKSSHRNVVRLVGGADVDVSNACVRVGRWSSHSNLLCVADEGTVFSALKYGNNGNEGSDYPLTVGQNGNWNEFRVTDGATALGGYVVAGGQLKNDSASSGTTSLWNRVTVENGATLNLLGELRAGWRHGDAIGNGAAAKSLFASNVIEITSGAQVTAARGIRVGTIPTSRDNRLVASGEGTTLTLGSPSTTANVYVGEAGGSGNLVEISGGATISGVNELSVGYGTSHLFDDLVSATGSNNCFKIEKASLATASIMNFGYYCNGGNRLFVGDGASLEVAGIRMHGFGQEIVVSNGVFTTKGYGFIPAYVGGSVGPVTNRVDGVAYYRDAYTADDSGRHRFSFYGTGRIVKGQTYDVSPFTNACRFVFHVPAAGYQAAPLESTSAKLVFSDDTEFDFDFSELPRHGLRNVPLVAYTGGNSQVTERLVMSDALVAKIAAGSRK